MRKYIVLITLLFTSVLNAQSKKFVEADEVVFGRPQSGAPAGEISFRNTTQKIRANKVSGNLEFSSDGINYNEFSSGGPALLEVRSVTTTDTAVLGDDVLSLSGASFTQTLFTAIGNEGKVLTLKHNGTSLTQIYTINTTGGQTIGGYASGAYALYTNGETLKIVSDGSNWLILDHVTETDWVDAGAFINFYTFTVSTASATLASVYTNGAATCTTAKTIASQTTLIMRCNVDPDGSGTLTKSSGTGDATITFSAWTGKPFNVSATTTAPTFSGGFTTNSYRWKRNGRFAVIWAQFYWATGSGAGVVGSGDYIWSMPENLVIDSTIYPNFTGGAVQSINSQTAATIASIFPAIGGRAFISGGQYNVSMWAPYSSTSYRIYGFSTNTDGEYAIGSSYAQASNTGGSYQWQIEIPVDGWKP